MIKDFFIYFKKKDISIRLYIVAVAIFFIGIFFIKKDVDTFFKIFYISMGLFEIGFVVWVYSFFKKYINFKYVKFFWFFFHLAVLWLAAVYASKIVSKGLELPSSDYSYTVSFFTFFCYLPAFLYIATAIGLLFYIVFIFAYSILSIFKREILSDGFPILHFIGFVITIFLFSLGHDKLMSFYYYKAPKYVRTIAYETDYQYIPKYLDNFPEMNKQVKIKLHENGVYSILTKQENEYILEVGKFK
ncbi:MULTISPECIES: hypothetical protein [Acinetobacter calcoaceticus/baumannii complex]|uniref:hypothetical protein n=1 Tax=Acinetobacter calcoaceticus/baumannii complex TaxID=909768 RepID=UPI00044A4469|nr:MULTISPECIES: hypothetical protein [Acinetobacter calcoaceticus/baumannii complex]EXS35069.1 putative membrane protein [Acinetobacter sp. 826659]RZH08821.1 hypothetical protein EXE02_14430 [Acinetobacter pittii]